MKYGTSVSRQGLEIADKPPGFGLGLELILRFNLESLRPARLEERAPGKGIYPAIPQNAAGRGSVVGMRPQASRVSPSLVGDQRIIQE